MNSNVILPKGIEQPNADVTDKIDEFLGKFETHEINSQSKLVLYYDAKSSAYYLICHLNSSKLISSCDLEAALDGNDEDEIYKLNRDITEDQAAFKVMEDDARKGRSFEDMVVEYDTTYNSAKPLKIYGGQHRIKAIMNAKNNSVLHGVRIFFNLTRDQKAEIATINNTSIVVPNDLLDRVREQLLGSKLRDWCQKVGLLPRGEDFADRKSPNVPTVRIARTLLVNYCLGLEAKEEDFHAPVVCKSGGMDDYYLDIHNKIKWDDENIVEMGKNFARLHNVQKECVLKRTEENYAEFARKALSLAVVAAWAYAAGLFQRNQDSLKCHYAIPDSTVAPEDPLNAKALSQARLKGTDPDTYRGLGTRSSPTELGRMLEVFIVQATKASKKRITKELANAAIQSYEAKKAASEANKAIGRI